MKYNTNELREIENIHLRAAKNLLAEKGSQHWTASDQTRYDSLLDRAELAQGERERLSNQRYGVELFIAKSLNDMSAIERNIVRNTMSTTTGSQGGSSVPALVAAEITSLAKDVSPMRRACSQMFTSTGAAKGYPTSDGSNEVGEQIGQNASATVVDPSFGNADMATYKYSSKTIAMPLELLQDMVDDPLRFVGQRVMDRIGRIQNAKFTTGTGTGEPTGIITAASVGKLGTTGQTLTVIYDDLVDLVDAIDAGHPFQAFMLSQATRKVVRRIKDTNGRPVWNPNAVDVGSEGASLGGSLLGYPVYINNDMATPAANAKTIAFGNFKKYMIRDAMEVTLFRFDDSAYTKLGQVGFLAWARAGGNLLDSAAVRVYQHPPT